MYIIQVPDKNMYVYKYDVNVYKLLLLTQVIHLSRHNVGFVKKRLDIKAEQLADLQL